ncbi:MAG: glycosyltransferase, partial [Pseudomonadota bacterium]
MVADLPAGNAGLYFYIPSFAGGGAERIFIRIANYLANEGHKVGFIVNHDGGPLKDMLSSKVDLQVLGIERGAKAIFALAKLLRKLKPQVLISVMTRTNIVAILAYRLSGQSTRIICCERNHYSTILNGFDPVRRWMMDQSVRRLYPVAYAVIGNTPDVTQDVALAAGLSQDQTAVIPNPAPDCEELNAARDAPMNHPWFNDDKPVAIAIGRLVAQKDYPTMLEAVAKSGDELRLAVLGTGPDQAALEAYAEELGIEDRVEFLGFRMDRFAYLVRADVFLLSSITEGFPNALIEAVAAGIPAVTTDCAGGGAREILGPEFPERIVPVGDATAMADVIKSILDARASGDETSERVRADRVAQRFQIDA